jgi:hypothetical protein
MEEGEVQTGFWGYALPEEPAGGQAAFFVHVS